MVFALLCLALGLFWGCEKASDGPMSITLETFDYYDDGFFMASTLDSGKTIHLSNDTLFLNLDKMWTFTNCSLTSIDLNLFKEDSVLWIVPVLKIHATEEDCPAPYYRPDTTLKINLTESQMSGVGLLKVKNDRDSVLDSILLRRGTISLDTFYIYMDSSFADPHAFPLRTKDTKNGKAVPSILRVLDSLTPRVFYWRTMESVCKYVVDKCGDKVADTVYPSTWKLNDTNLVPIHYFCADSDSVYCLNSSKWENDSSSLGKLQERPDTIWHYSTYYMEKIPKCGTYGADTISNYMVGERVRIVRELLTPAKEETFCGPSSKEDWYVFNLTKNVTVYDNDSVAVLDTLFEIWNGASVAPDTLVVEDD